MLGTFEQSLHTLWKYQAFLFETSSECIPESLGLLTDLLKHEMFEAALLSSLHIPIDMLYRTLESIPVEVVNLDIIAGYDRNIQILEVLDFARMAQERRDITGNQIRMLTTPYDQRTVLSCNHHRLGMLRANHGNGIRAFQALDRLSHREQEIPVVVKVYQMSDHLTVCLAGKRDLMAFQPRAELGVVFDDAVVHNCN
ncbi:hypothetical protein SDC9_130543 [bioreactor metagenome]|uniref:Uncharacterized protein n=1 Tax=bioreactor metagenome TaxID=1076179 RepID=A0A645D2P8_9ZZZZ